MANACQWLTAEAPLPQLYDCMLHQYVVRVPHNCGGNNRHHATIQTALARLC